MITEKEKYLAWYKDQKENHGLIYCKPIGNPVAYFDESAPLVPEGTTEEDIYRAMNALNQAVAEGRCKELTDL